MFRGQARRFHHSVRFVTKVLKLIGRHQEKGQRRQRPSNQVRHTDSESVREVLKALGQTESQRDGRIKGTATNGADGNRTDQDTQANRHCVCVYRSVCRTDT